MGLLAVVNGAITLLLTGRGPPGLGSLGFITFFRGVGSLGAHFVCSGCLNIFLMGNIPLNRFCSNGWFKHNYTTTLDG